MVTIYQGSDELLISVEITSLIKREGYQVIDFEEVSFKQSIEYFYTTSLFSDIRALYFRNLELLSLTELKEFLLLIETFQGDLVAHYHGKSTLLTKLKSAITIDLPNKREYFLKGITRLAKLNGEELDTKLWLELINKSDLTYQDYQGIFIKSLYLPKGEHNLSNLAKLSSSQLGYEAPWTLFQGGAGLSFPEKFEVIPLISYYLKNISDIILVKEVLRGKESFLTIKDDYTPYQWELLSKLAKKNSSESLFNKLESMIEIDRMAKIHSEISLINFIYKILEPIYL